MCTVYLIHLNIGPSGLRAIVAPPWDLLRSNPPSLSVSTLLPRLAGAAGALLCRDVQRKWIVVMLMLVPPNREDRYIWDVSVVGQLQSEQNTRKLHLYSLCNVANSGGPQTLSDDGINVWKCLSAIFPWLFLFPQLFSSTPHGHLRNCKKTVDTGRTFMDIFSQENTPFVTSSVIFSDRFMRCNPRLSSVDKMLN